MLVGGGIGFGFDIELFGVEPLGAAEETAFGDVVGVTQKKFQSYIFGSEVAIGGFVPDVVVGVWVGDNGWADGGYVELRGGGRCCGLSVQVCADVPE